MADANTTLETPPPDTSAQQVAVRRRQDVSVAESEFQGEKCWILKDPVALKYYRIREPEYLIFSMLDGQVTVSDIQSALSRLMGGVDVEEQQVRNLIGSLYQRELLVGRKNDQAERLLEQTAKMTRMRRVSRFTNLLSIRFPGVDPERFLAWLYPKTKWFFHPLAVFICVSIMILAGITLVVNANEFTARLPEMQRFFGFQNLLMMGLLLVVTKSIHEIGHGLSCKHFGGECHEIGFMLLVLMPVMYCNTSDSWVLKNKWHRIAIGAAGMYIEVIIASLCTFVWWYTNPGTLNSMCLNVMFISSVTTVIFNANPLLRYDGYYMLSDLLEIPNMAQKSRAALLSKMRTLCLGFAPMPSRMLPQKNQMAFVFYSIASFCYRWFILFVILWFISEIFEPYGLQIIGQYMIGVSLISLFVLPLVKLYKFFSHEQVRSQVNVFRLVASVVVFAVIMLALWFVPIPHYVNAPFVIRPQAAESVYVTNPGILANCKVKPGQEIGKDDIVAVLENPEIETRYNNLLGVDRALQREIRLLGQLESFPANQVSQLGSKVLEREANKELLANELKVKESLVLRSPIKGFVLPPTRQRPPNPDSQDLSFWNGSPMDPENERSFLDRNTEFCLIGTGKFEAVLEIDQTNIDLVNQDCHVKLVFDEYQMRRIVGKVQATATSKTSAVSNQSSQMTGGGVATQVDGAGRQMALYTSYQAIVPIETDDDMQILNGFRGHAKINVGNTPLGQQVWRYIRTVFNFK